MGDPRGFLDHERQEAAVRPVCERIRDCAPVSVPRPEKVSRDQASRCIDCGTPFCHGACPLGNYVPEWNRLFAAGHYAEAIDLLDATNNLPEITGRVCPAPCEYACVLGVPDDPVTIRENELALVKHAFERGYARLKPPQRRTGKAVAVIGSGPAGLSCAIQLNRAGHRVTVFERDRKAGGILRYGIPDFKLEKRVLDKRIAMMMGEGVAFECGQDVGVGYPARKVLARFDAVCLAGGARAPRDLPIEGRELKGIHFAMDYLTQANRRAAGEALEKRRLIDAKGRKVVVIGGGDTGADCVGTACRQGASCVMQIELLERPPECRTDAYPWPAYPMLLKTSTSHEEGCERLWSVLTKRFSGAGGKVERLSCVRVEQVPEAGSACPSFREVPGSGFDIEADLVLLAVGFLGAERKGLVEELGLELDGRGSVKTGPDLMTSRKSIFAAGDMRRGQSLVVWAIAEGRRAARSIDTFLMGTSDLPAL